LTRAGCIKPAKGTAVLRDDRIAVEVPAKIVKIVAQQAVRSSARKGIEVL